MGIGFSILISSWGNSNFYSSFNPQVSLFLRNLLLVPTITKNLPSVSQFAQDNLCYFEFHPYHCFVKSQATEQVLLRGTLTSEGLYAFHDLQPSICPRPSTIDVSKQQVPPRFPFSVNKIVHNTTSGSSSYSLWHCMLGHANDKVVSNVLTTCKISHCNKSVLNFCSACCLGKSHKLHASNSINTYPNPFDLLYADLWRPAPIDSTTGFRYYFSLVDAATRHTSIYLLKLKSDTITLFDTFLTMVKTQFNKTVKSIQSDWGGEFRPFTSYLTKLGISHRVACPHTHHQNGTVERKHKHIVETGLTLLAHGCLPLKFWDHVFLKAIYLINKMPYPNLAYQSPHKLLFHTSPDYLSLRVFDCSCFPNLRPFNKYKLDFRSSECTFLGYSLSHKGYKCLTSDGKIVISKDVVFNEHRFPYATPFHSSSSTPTTTTSPDHILIFYNPTLVPSHTPSPISSFNPYIPTPISLVSSGSPHQIPHSVNTDISESIPLSNNLSPPNNLDVPIESSQTTDPVSTDFDPSLTTTPRELVSVPTSSHPMQTRSKLGIFKIIYPITKLIKFFGTTSFLGLNHPLIDHVCQIRNNKSVPI
ncbi:PREDICTED: uncharacterized protein LOC109338075 [Lupinus angustifolius]|uniref:uncharacterized protein LOC109338075 n=1 Tax=Lupinus angustifolius TaxID=3871 RepID=UPI00092F847A|nr:PREDICTED: uncharacterized protein LOC109338075 [Lupinus angustifolius]